MINWIKNLFTSKSTRARIAYAESLARDEQGRWLYDDKGVILKKTDDPKQIAKAIVRRKERDLAILEFLANGSSKSTCCENGSCKCKETSSRQRHPAGKGRVSTSVDLEKKPATKKTTPKKK
jgi:hypothetical protein